MKSEQVNPIRQHLQRAVRYTIAAVAGVLFAYVAWAPQPPPGTDEPKAGPIELPAAMLDALREQGVMRLPSRSKTKQVPRRERASVTTDPTVQAALAAETAAQSMSSVLLILAGVIVKLWKSAGMTSRSNHPT